MKVAVVAHFYPPEPGAGALRVYSLAQALAADGNDVTVVTVFPSFPRGEFAEARRPFIRVEQNGRVRSVRLFSMLVAHMPGARLLHWLSAAISSSVYLLGTRTRFDAVVVSSPPITVGLAGVIGAARHRAQLVVDVRDVFPDLGVKMGVWKADSPVVKTLEWLVRRLYRRADLVSVVTPAGEAQALRRGVPPSRVVLARNAYETTPVMSEPKRLNDGFTAVYAGNLGLTTDIDVLVDAAKLLSTDGITIEIVGDGAQRARLDERIHEEGVANVHARGSFPRDEAMAMVAGADVCVIPLRRGLTESIPTKLYDSLSVGCPAIVVADGEAQIEGTSLGATCTPAGDARALADALRKLSQLDNASLRKLGEDGKERIRKRSDRAAIMTDLSRRIAALVRACHPEPFDSLTLAQDKLRAKGAESKDELVVSP
jgi:colanic acid biosynthesis glycosyl transferase WcaI